LSSRPVATTLCAFVALELAKPLQLAIADEIGRLDKAIPAVTWTEPRRMHVTLRFLGWTTRDRLSALEPYLAAAAAECLPLAAKVSGLGTFPPSGAERARVLWAGVTLPRSGRKLQAACEAAALECGFPPERRVFQAHVTLGRWKEGARLRSLPDFDVGATQFDNLVIFRSEPTKGEVQAPGVRRALSAYARLAVFPLG
jgi:2'-5' RNA ligase